MRMQMRRFTRLTNAFSKKIENQRHSLTFYFVWYKGSHSQGAQAVARDGGGDDASVSSTPCGLSRSVSSSNALIWGPSAGCISKLREPAWGGQRKQTLVCGLK
jgi:hypothetical protein